MLVLASQSQTRKTLLENAGLALRTTPAGIDERAREAEVGAGGGGKVEIALALAEAKALAVSAREPGAFVIGADQTLEAAGIEAHKPRTRAQAASQLRALAGREHSLHSAAALVRDGVVLWRGCDSALLRLRDFSAAELETVLDLEGEKIFGSVAGYRLEGPSIRLFESISGDYFTVLGLPLLSLLAALAAHAPAALVPPKATRA